MLTLELISFPLASSKAACKILYVAVTLKSTPASTVPLDLVRISGLQDSSNRPEVGGPTAYQIQEPLAAGQGQAPLLISSRRRAWQGVEALRLVTCAIVCNNAQEVS